MLMLFFSICSRITDEVTVGEDVDDAASSMETICLLNLIWSDLPTQIALIIWKLQYLAVYIVDFS